MDEYDELTRSHMQMVLQEVCNNLPHGCEHETRKYVAESLIDAAHSGKTCRDNLLPIALRALLEVKNSARTGT